MSLDFETLTAVVIEQTVAWLPKIGGAVAVFLIGWILAGALTRVSKKALRGSRVDDSLIPFLGSVIHMGLGAMVVIAAISTLGIPAASFVAVIGAAGLAVALAFQGTFSNFAAGVMLLTFRPFKLGDFVEVAGQAGTVKEIGIFATVMATPDNVQVNVPNSGIFGETIKNFSANANRRIDLVVGVAYDDDLGTAVRTCQDVVAADPRVLSDPPTVVAVSEMADSSMNLVVRPWVATPDYWPTRWDLTRALKEQLEAAGCTIPYPQRDVHLFQEQG